MTGPTLAERYKISGFLTSRNHRNQLIASGIHVRVKKGWVILAQGVQHDLESL